MAVPETGRIARSGRNAIAQATRTNRDAKRVSRPIPPDRPGRPTTVRLFVRPALRTIGSRLLVRDWLAITIGTRIVSWRPLQPAELAHELEHVRQWQRHGRAGYVLRYGLASLRARIAGHDWYRDNAFERAARDAAAAAGSRERARGSTRDGLAGGAPDC